jgi:GNAT superfamily N-acetyltransferase
VNLDAVHVRPVARSEEPLHGQLMAAHHYLGFLPKIGHTLWYVATYYEQWVGLLIFSAAAWKCAVRDQWIGWDFHRQYDYDRLKLIANNSRFLILPDWHRPNLGSKILSLCQKRLSEDWQKCFGHRLLLLETFVDPQRFRGTVYRAANWTYLGLTRGYRRTRQGYSNTVDSPKKVFVKSLQSNARTLLACPVLPLPYRQGVPKMMLSAQQMQSLPDFFVNIPDPRRPQGRRHSLPTVLAIACAAILCGMRGYKAIADWAQSLGPKARERLRCRRVNGRYVVPSESIIRDVMIRVGPIDLDRSVQRWNQAYGQQDTTLAIDGKTMCNALDKNGHQTHVMSVVGHHTKSCYTQKKLAACHPREIAKS